MGFFGVLSLLLLTDLLYYFCSLQVIDWSWSTGLDQVTGLVHVFLPK
jgi:hypothetical protein